MHSIEHRYHSGLTLGLLMVAQGVNEGTRNKKGNLQSLHATGFPGNRPQSDQ